jgi:alpha-mannosidase
MPIRRTSLILPCRTLEEFPSHLQGPAAAELLAGWTAMWHPALLAATGQLPSWHSAEEPPDVDSLDAELVLVPSISRLRLPSDWCDRLRATTPRNPLPVEVAAMRADTIAAALAAAASDPSSVDDKLAGDFLALGYAHLQVELLTRAMHYAAVLDTAQFQGAVIEAAGAAVAGRNDVARDELARAFDLLMDARNHVYSVDFYVIDVTLLAGSTLGESLRSKLSAGFPTSLLTTGELLQQMADEQPESLAELRTAADARTACVFGGRMHGGPASGRSPEAILTELLSARETAIRLLGHAPEVFGQFSAGFSTLLPEILSNCGFEAALHTAFDGGPMPKSQQKKTHWGARNGSKIDALSATPLDIARPETWLTLAEQINDSIAHDHVATILLAGWPEQACEYYDDLRRVSAYGPILGRPVTIDEYFRVTREVETWSTFEPSEYPRVSNGHSGAEAVSASVKKYRADVSATRDSLVRGLVEIVTAAAPPNPIEDGELLAVNPWNFPCEMLVSFDPIGEAPPANDARWLPAVPGCGFARLERVPALPSPTALAAGRVLHNEHLEITIHEAAGGIQSLKSHRDRRTRLSQRLVMHDERTARRFADANHTPGNEPRLETQMVADRIEVTQSNHLVGEITSHGRLLDAGGELLAKYAQAVRLVRGIPAAFIAVELDVARWPDGELWSSYFASRVAWSVSAPRRGVGKPAREPPSNRVARVGRSDERRRHGRLLCPGSTVPPPGIKLVARHATRH